MLLYCIISMGAWYEDAYNWLKGAVKDVSEVVGAAAPLVSMFLKKGGKVKEVPDTPANRAKLLRHFNKMHKTKLTMKMYNEIISAKGGKKLKLASK